MQILPDLKVFSIEGRNRKVNGELKEIARGECFLM
jgi:hypothetical protein